MLRVIATSMTRFMGCFTQRSFLVWLLVFAEVSAAVGFPIIAPQGHGKDASRPFPCMDRPCGCAGYDECWAGDCCCFTLAEKIAWAKKNDITPPASAIEKAAHSKPAPKKACPHCDAEEEIPPCCAKPKTVRLNWIIGVYALNCKGQTFVSYSLQPLAVPPELPKSFVIEQPAGPREPIVDCLATVQASSPDSPPPRC